jgi:glycosyltransferase involved in cell wall biosynthesis
MERLNMGRLAAKVARHTRVDVVHFHDPLMAWGFQLARRCGYHGTARWGLSQHGFGSYSDAIGEEGVPYTRGLLRWQRSMEARILAAADFVICPTNAGRRQLARDLSMPGPSDHWYVVSHARPAIRLMCRQEARQALGWDRTATCVVAVGRLNPVKRLDRIVRACVQTQRPLHLTILGEGDEATVRRLHELISGSAQLTLKVHPVDDVGPYLAAADLYVSAALNESFGMANLEAVAMGLPAICTAVGGVPEVVGACAQLIPGEDQGLERVLAKAICDLLDDEPRRTRMATEGRQWAQSIPEPQAVGEQLIDIYSGRRSPTRTDDV